MHFETDPTGCSASRILGEDRPVARASVSSTCRWLGRSVAHARTPGARAGVTNDPPLLICPQRLTNVRFRSSSLHTYTPSQQQLRKRKLAARDFGPRAPPMSRGDGRKDSADRLLPPQGTGMSRYSVAEEVLPLHHAGNFVLRERRHKASQNSELVRLERRSAFVCFRRSMDGLARLTRAKERARGWSA
jgi:hypothetical protein